jgi:hypothetical protein
MRNGSNEVGSPGGRRRAQRRMLVRGIAGLTALTAIIVPTADALNRAGGRTVVACALRSKPYFTKPHSCTFAARGTDGGGAAGITIIRMRWSHWGRRHAVARGTFAGNMDYRAPATVRLSHRIRCKYFDTPTYGYTSATIRLNGEKPEHVSLNRCDESEAGA